MPFTVSPSSYQGGAYLEQGLSGLGRGIGTGVGDALMQYEKNKQQDAFSDAMFEYLKTVPGAVPAETLAKFHDMNRNQKNAAIVSAQFALKERADRQAAEDKRRLDIAHANYYQMRANPTAELGGNFTPRTTTINPPGGRPFNMVQRSPQQWERIYEPGEIQYSPDGIPFTTNTKGEIKLQDPAKIAEAKAFKKAEDAANATPTPTPGGGAGAGGGLMDMVRSFLMRSGLGRPSGTPAPGPTAVPEGASPAPATPAPGNADQRLQQARAAIAKAQDRGVDITPQVRQKLQAMGIDPNLL